MSSVWSYKVAILVQYYWVGEINFHYFNNKNCCLSIVFIHYIIVTTEEQLFLSENIYNFCRIQSPTYTLKLKYNYIDKHTNTASQNNVMIINYTAS